jgi:NADP-dependent 3-hydroxy acid dehydrogenase YdfG/acyl carrier protein
LTVYNPIKTSSSEHEHEYSVLITGGSSKICLKLVEQLLLDNQATIVLMVRNQHSLTELGPVSSRLKVVYGDITDAKVVNVIIANIALNHPPLKYVFHAAGVLQDGLFSSLSWDSMQAVMTVKMLPLLYLDKACRDQQIKLTKLITFSSIATIRGGHGQTSYAGANAFMEGSMYKMSPATAIAFPPILSTRMADNSPLVQRHPHYAISIEEAVDALKLAMTEDVGPIFVPMNAPLLNHLKSHSLYQNLFTNESESSRFPESCDGLVNSLSTLSHSERTQAVKQFLLRELGRVMQLNPHEFNESSGFFELGMDSLMAVELFERIQKSLGKQVKLNSTLLFDLPNVASLTDYLIQALYPENPKPDQAVHRVDTLSDQDLLSEIEAMLPLTEDIL